MYEFVHEPNRRPVSWVLSFVCLHDAFHDGSYTTYPEQHTRVVVNVDADHHRVFALEYESNGKYKAVVDVARTHHRYVLVNGRVDLDVVAHVDETIRLDTHDDYVGRVEAPVNVSLVHGGVCDADVVGPLVEHKGRAPAEMRHPVVEDEAVRVLLVVHELAQTGIRAVHHTQRVEVVNEVELVVLDERHPVLVSWHVVRLSSVHHRRAAFDLRNDGHVAVVVPHDGEVHVVVVRERHGTIEGDVERTFVDDEARLDGSVSHPPLLRQRDADDGAVADRPHVAVELLRVQPIVGEVIGRPVFLLLVPFSLQPDARDQHELTLIPDDGRTVGVENVVMRRVDEASRRLPLHVR